MIARSRVRLPVIQLSGNNPGQIVHTPQPVRVMPLFGNLADLGNQINILPKNVKTIVISAEVIANQ